MTFDELRNLIYFNTKTNSSSLLNADLNNLVTPALHHVISLLNKYDARWQYDDSNRSDRPSATFALVAGQADYTLPTSHLTLDRAEVLPNGGGSDDWRLLFPIDRRDLRHTSLQSHRSANGLPVQYDLIGRSFMPYPKSNYAQAASIRLWFTRGALGYDYTANGSAGLFTDATGLGATTDTPGFNEDYHELIATRASYKYALANGQKTANGFLTDALRDESSLQDFIGNRNRNTLPRFTVSTNRFRQNESGVISFRGGDSNE